jgi:hypothetical protein
MGPVFAGARILIIPDNDEEGANAAARWSSELWAFGAADVEIQELDDEFHDLNDYLKSQPSDPLKLIEGAFS